MKNEIIMYYDAENNNNNNSLNDFCRLECAINLDSISWMDSFKISIILHYSRMNKNMKSDIPVYFTLMSNTVQV